MPIRIPDGGGVATTYRLVSDKDTHFTGMLNADSHETESISGLQKDSVVITGLSLITKENLDWEVFFWSSSAFDDADLDVDLGSESVYVSAWDAVTISNGTPGTFRYYISGLRIPYVDSEATTTLHVSIAPRNGTKAAGSAGAVRLTVFYEA